MIPGNGITSAPIVGGFSFPLSEEYTPLVQKVWGGQALGDGSKGRLLKLWEVRWSAEAGITVGPIGQAVVFSLQVANVLTVGLAFDTAMRVVLTWTTTSGAYLYYYDTIAQDYTTRFFADVTSSRVAVDDPRSFYTSQSDVFFAYTLEGNLYWRQQRDRYDDAHVMGPTPGSLIKVGLSKLNRLQFEIYDGETQPIPIDETSLDYLVIVKQLSGFDPAT